MSEIGVTKKVRSVKKIALKSWKIEKRMPLMELFFLQEIERERGVERVKGFEAR